MGGIVVRAVRCCVTPCVLQTSCHVYTGAMLHLVIMRVQFSSADTRNCRHQKRLSGHMSQAHLLQVMSLTDEPTAEHLLLA